MQTSRVDVRALGGITLCLLAWLNAHAAPGTIILFNGTSSAGKSSLAEAMVENSSNRYAVVSFDDFQRAYREKHQVTAWKPDQHEDCLLSLYRHAKELSEAGTNVIIDTVEFDRAYDKYCEILDCRVVVKVIVYCPPEGLLKRIERRNDSGVPENRRPVLLSFQQFREMYRRQASPDDLEVVRTSTRLVREALIEACSKAQTTTTYSNALYRSYVTVFGIDQDREIVIVPRGKYDLVLNTRAQTKRQNVRALEEYIARARSRKRD